MENRLSSNDSSFDAPVNTGDGENEIMAPSQYLEDKRFNPEDLVEAEQTMAFNNAELLDALKGLDDRRQCYTKDIYPTLRSSSSWQKVKISIERIEQIKNGALKKLNSMTDAL